MRVPALQRRLYGEQSGVVPAFQRLEGVFLKMDTASHPEAVLRSLIFFDFRPVRGDILLAERLRAFLGHAIKGNNPFLAHMAVTVLLNRPPLGLFGNIITERKGPERGTFDIKIRGLCPIIDLVRLAALEAGVYHTSTLARLADLKDRNGTIGSVVHELEQAFEFLMSLRLGRQFRQIEEGRAPNNRIDPATWASWSSGS